MYRSEFAAEKVKMSKHTLMMSGKPLTPARIAATTKGEAVALTVVPDVLLAVKSLGLS